MNTKRLTKLIEFMETAPKEVNNHFHMGVWFDHWGKDDHGIKDGQKITRKELQLCGTKACALGWATTIPSFRRAGLELKAGSIGRVVFKGVDGADHAAAAFFGCDHVETQALFYDMAANTTRQWAKGARRLLRKWARASA